ncbi:hypothetical protein [Desulfitobacterium chlororespirans]|uniref:Uncharacterized protein n=1 Tax=Desulfitobacterium chlororespirans DSM 11544 TaxID=1121395 RepID=A0A1M7RWW2_9FIRM|nr:hypothetical protein [Desulfitobacterium chlororespirans]SHN50604.1 hypothetical protein SAMN02745215_00204 [Desulfitobacterium chlororespirans DSM 11544]
MENLQDEIIKVYHENKFLQTIYEISVENYQDQSLDFYELLIDLHNQGSIDVVEAFKSLKNLPGHERDFFRTRHILEKLLSKINAPVFSAMECVLNLVREAGQDGAAGTIISSFGDFCKADSSRPKEALAYIESSAETLADLLVSVIVAGADFDLEYYHNQAVRFLTHEDINIRRRAIFALGRINYLDNIILLQSGLAALEYSVSQEDDDIVLANIIRSSFSLFRQNQEQEKRYYHIISTALSKGGDYALHAATELFSFEKKELTDELVDILLSVLWKVNLQNKGTLNILDFALSNLLESNYDKGLPFMEKLLLNNPESMFDEFDSVISIFRKQENKNKLNNVGTRWLLKGEKILCKAISEIIKQTNATIEADPKEIEANNAATIVFLARKGIGYLFYNPITATSLLVSLIPQVKENEIKQELAALLFDPLLINFPGKVGDYLKQQLVHLADESKEVVNNTLKMLEDYLNDLHTTGEIFELRPSQIQKNAYQRYFSELLSESMKKAEKESVFLSLVSKSILLYGRKSINYIYEKSGEPKRMEIPLHSHSTEMEMPRIVNIDPFGVDYMLRVFRTERINQ